MKRFVWLASYPKSGNTWFRAFLSNFLHDGDEPLSLDRLIDCGPASARGPFDAAVGYPSGEMKPDEIELLRPEVYRHQARNATGRLYWKAHDAYTLLRDGRPLFPPEATDCALYFVRNPLDVCVSFAHHAGGEFDRVIARMGDPAACFGATDRAQTHQLRQRLLTWSGHVLSWRAPPGVRVKVIRFEDMKQRPDETFADAVRFLGLPDDARRTRKAIAFSAFAELSRQERQSGFAEKTAAASAFFRQGETGSWRKELSRAQAQRLITDHAEVMRQMGYLDEQGEAVF
jgi:hypothetical protein